MIARQILYGGILLKNQWKSLKDIKKMQENRLRFIVDHAYRYSQFYHTKFKNADVHPADICTLKDLKKIPVTTKDELRNANNILVNSYAHNCVTATTSGSTGKKLIISYNNAANDRYFAFNFRRFFSVGLRPWHTYAPISHIEKDTPRFRFAQFSYLYPIPGNIDHVRMTDMLTRIHPYAAGGHPNTLFLIAKDCESRGIELSLKFVALGGELSTAPEREYIEKVFECPTYNKYGSMELRHIAWECPEHRNMHMDADNNIIEILKEGEPVAPGEEGDLVGTNLWNMAMPFIRYNQYDVASLSDEVCACGRGLPLLSVIQGRRDDFLVLPSGKKIPPTLVVPIFFSLHEIDAFQVIQENVHQVTVKVVKGTGYTEDTSKRLVENMKKVLGPIDIILEEKDSIDQDTENLRAVISKVKKN
ncbi:MAG: hypothetical protein PVF58_08380 [Candidatus Methanofastidiosia archaeon]|jgi:phenylacetate-CoA ligase